jgi:DNA recombination protein RmuC
VSFLFMEIIFIYILCALFGGLVVYFLLRQATGNTILMPFDDKENFVARELYQTIVQQNTVLQKNIADKEMELRATEAALAAREQTVYSLNEKILYQKDEMLRTQQQLKADFEQLANRLLEEKSERFGLHNERQMTGIVAPLRDRLRDFEERADRLAQNEQTERIALRKEIEQLRTLNQQISSDALALANALKGDSKTQGDWGEIRLEMLLEKAGLERDIHFRRQNSFRDEQGNEKRPDFIINLPDGKHLILDSKVSLTAYERFFNAANDTESDLALRAHTDSLRRHIRDLSSKRYEQLYQIQTPDFVLLFVPIEPAFTLAIQNDPMLLTEAIERNVVLVTTSTLLATLRTIAFIWKQDKQRQNVMEIARQSGKLYDKLVGFVEDLHSIGKQLDQAQTAYQGALNKLSDSKKQGDTIIGRAEKIRELGANNTKLLPPM